MTGVTSRDPARGWLEGACRAVAIAALALAAWHAVREGRPTAASDARVGLRPLTVTAAELSADSADRLSARIRTAVVAGAARGAPDTIAVTLPAIPSAPVRAVLSALPPAGVPVRWVDSSGSAGLALSVASVPGPRAAYVVRATGGSPTQPLVLRDRGGLLDSLPASGNARRTDGAWSVVSLSPPVEARVGATVATAAVPDTGAPKRLLVIAQPGWESKFTIAALEELGWRVDGSLRISPTGAVQVGAPQRLDTARYAAVIVLDSMAVDAASLTRFVSQGGGLVLAGDALRIPSLAAVRPVKALEIRGAVAGALLTAAPRRGLEAWEVELMPEATVLQADDGEDGADPDHDHDHAEPAVVVRRTGAGRVAATAYRETWRWRMQGTDDGASEHRAWWGGVVAAVAPDAPRAADTVEEMWPGAAAPYADLVAHLGAASPLLTVAAADSTTRRDFLRASPALLLVVAALALLTEWASRRLRGLR